MTTPGGEFTVTCTTHASDRSGHQRIAPRPCNARTAHARAFRSKVKEIRNAVTFTGVSFPGGRMLRALIVAAVIAAPTAAYPCMNEVMLEGNEAVKRLAKVEKLLEGGLYRKARNALDGYAFVDPRHQQRAEDYSALIVLRVDAPRRKVAWLAGHFEQRVKANKKDLRARAWLAEAYAIGGKPEAAREILLDLRTRDLMPDAHAYLTLARISNGSDRETALAECQKRAKVKAMCTVPAAPKPAT